MRMWMCNPRIMCRQHLIGEYRELFTFIGSLKKKISMDGYFKNNLFEPLSLLNRYEILKQEMLDRGYNPTKEFKFDEQILNYLGDKKYIKVNKKESLKDLRRRCSECEKRYWKYRFSHTSWNKNLTKNNNKILKQISDTHKKLYKENNKIMGFGSKNGYKTPKNNIPWNKGLTKETDIRLKLNGEKISQAWKNKSEKDKNRLRKIQRNLTVERITKHPNKNKTNTLPERKFKIFLKEMNINFKHNYPIKDIEHAYPADFYLPEYNTIIEVDGKK